MLPFGASGLGMYPAELITLSQGIVISFPEASLHTMLSSFILIRMVFHEERIDTAFSSGETASAGHGGVDLILGNKVLDGWHLGKL